MLSLRLTSGTTKPSMSTLADALLDPELERRSFAEPEEVREIFPMLSVLILRSH